MGIKSPRGINFLRAFYHSGQSVTQLSKEYDVAPATIYKWIDLYS
ncbi:hypothetical protein EFO12_13220, partial [Lactococcus cremoris]